MSTIAKLDSLRQRIETDAKIKNASPEQRAKLLAAWLISPARSLLVLPDFSPIAVNLMPVLVGDCSHTALPFSAQAPVVCHNCRKQVGTVNGLATGTKQSFTHPGCEFNWREPPWFITEGFNLIAHAAFPHNGRDKAALLSHYIITGYLENESRERNKYAAPNSSDGFEYIQSLGAAINE